MSSKITVRHSGFTLVEMLAVITIISALLLVLGPSIVGLSRGKGVTRAIDDITATFENARSQAMARNTWVYACFSNPIAGANSTNQLIVIELGSIDGVVNTSSTSGSAATLTTTNLRQLLPAMKISNACAMLVDANNAATASMLTCSFTTSGSSVQYDTIIAFSPQGEALLNPSSAVVTDWLQLQVAEFRYAAITAQNTALVKLSGTSGQTVLVRQ